jgi:hypothetical protein
VRAAVGRTLYTLRVAALWTLVVAAGTVVLLVLIVGAVLHFTRPPSAESEVRRFLSAQAGEDVVVDDCKHVPVDSIPYKYRCELRIAERVRIVDALGNAATLGPGASTRCFSVFRSSRSGTDDDPWLETC